MKYVIALKVRGTSDSYKKGKLMYALIFLILLIIIGSVKENGFKFTFAVVCFFSALICLWLGFMVGPFFLVPWIIGYILLQIARNLFDN